MDSSPWFLYICCGHSILWWENNNINIFSLGCLLDHQFLVVIIGNGETGGLTVSLDQVQLFFLQNQAINFICDLSFWHWK